jgi:hypothetical protein
MGQRRKQLVKMNRDVVVEDAPFGGKSATFTIRRKFHTSKHSNSLAIGMFS